MPRGGYSYFDYALFSPPEKTSQKKAQNCTLVKNLDFFCPEGFCLDKKKLVSGQENEIGPGAIKQILWSVFLLVYKSRTRVIRHNLNGKKGEEKTKMLNEVEANF